MAAEGGIMSRTDRILAAIRDELERRRNEVEDASIVRSVSVIVSMNERTGQPDMIICRVETKRAIDSRRVCAVV